MGKWINAERLFEETATWEARALEEVSKYNYKDSRDEWLWWSAVLQERTAFKHDILDAQSIDLVTCGECKHWYNDADTGTACEFTNMHEDADGYCSYGERK